MHLFRRARRDQPRSAAAVPPVAQVLAEDDLLADAPFTCTTCGRSDLPEAGDWDPPICDECDAAINFDALTLEMNEDH